MKRRWKFLLAIPVALIIGFAVFASQSGLKSDPDQGLSPQTHKVGNVDVRAFTTAPLGAEVKVRVPLGPADAMKLVTDFETYPSWVAPPPENVVVDNSARSDGSFGVGSILTYKAGESDEIVLYDSELAMIASPQWAPGAFEGHHGVVLVTRDGDGSIIHMRRYFKVKSAQGWMMSKMMPIFMKKSAENLASLHNGQVL